MTFSNSILAGEELVRTGMRSVGYVPNTFGWRLDRNGNADLNDVTVRGDLIVTGSNGQIHIYDDPTLGAIIALSDSGGGTFYFQGVLSGATHELALVGPQVAGLHNAAFIAGSDGGGSFFNFGADIIRLAAPVVLVDGVDYGDTGWFSPGFTNGWTDLGGNQACRYRMYGGRVEIQGVLAGGTINTSAFTLPAAMRPAGRLIFAAMSNNAFGRLDIQSDGSVRPVAGSNVSFSVCVTFTPA